MSDSVSANDLTDRLVRRASASIGMIDVHHAGRLHTRTAAWMEQRRDLLDNLKARYGVDQGAGSVPGTSMPLATTYRRMAGVGDATVSIPTPFVPSAMPAPVSEPRLESVPLPLSAPASVAEGALQFRVKRPSGIPDALQVQPTRPEPVSGTESEIRIQPRPAPSMQLQRKAVDTPRSASRPIPEMTPVSPAAPDAPTPTPVKVTDNPAGPRHLPQVSELPIATSAAPPMQLQRKMEGPTPLPAPAAEVPVSIPSPPVPQAFPRVTELRTVAGPVHTAAHPPGGYGQPARSPGVPPSMASIGTDSGGVISPEIRRSASSPPATVMLWRKADAGAAIEGRGHPPRTSPVMGSTDSSEPRIMRELAGSAPGTIPNAATGVAPDAANEAMDIGLVTKRVSRILARELAVERERRGKAR